MIGIAITAIASATAAASGAALIARRRRRTTIDEARRGASDRVERARRDAQADRNAGFDAARERAEDLRARLRADLEAEEAEADAEVIRLEARATRLEESAKRIEERNAELTEGFDGLHQRREEVAAAREALGDVERAIAESVERAAGRSRETVRARIEQEFVDGARLDARIAQRDFVDAATAASETRARHLLDVICQRYGVAMPAERLTGLVTLPKDGAVRERLLADQCAILRAVTEASDVEFLPTDTGDSFYLSAPETYTREIGRVVFDRLLRAKKPDEAFARKLVAETQADFEKTCRKAGQKANRILGLRDIHPEISALVGKLLFRTSYTQNQWQHAIEVAFLCGMMAEELGEDRAMARRAALLHDIGKVLWAETEAVGSHAVSGAAFAREHGEIPEIVHPIAAHHDDEKPASVLAHIVAGADALSGARPGARREMLESFTNRVDDLQRIAGGFAGIEKSYVIQGGRELRIFVDEKRVDDIAAAVLSSNVARQIEDECTYPGQIQVTVIREIRASAIAR